MQEHWKAVRGFTGQYEVSDLGRMRSLDRLVKHRGFVMRLKGRILKQVYSDGYYWISLSRSRTDRYMARVHILVARAFVPNPKHLPQVNHVDTNKRNNVYINLEWRTALGNMRHASKHNLLGDGVYWVKEENKIGVWVAQYCPAPNRREYLGRFKTRKAALIARNKAVKALLYAL